MTVHAVAALNKSAFNGGVAVKTMCWKDFVLVHAQVQGLRVDSPSAANCEACRGNVVRHVLMGASDLNSGSVYVLGEE